MNEPDAVGERRFAERFRAAYRSTPAPAPLERAQLVASLGARARRPTAWVLLRAWFEPRRVVVRPAVAAAVALALLATGALLAPHVAVRTAARPGEPSQAIGSRAVPEVRFALVMTAASSVSLVGDFNGWDASATPMRRDPASGVWVARVPLTPGWHSYAFIVDGTRWVADPRAPLAPADGFGLQHSVVVVEERAA